MSPEETRRLLGEIATVDNRKLTPDIVRIWHDMLHGFDYDTMQAALRTIRLNEPDTWIDPGHLAQIARRQATTTGNRRVPHCDHGVPVGGYCHDCTHPADCPMCMPIAGLSDTPENRRATVASLRESWSAEESA